MSTENMERPHHSGTKKYWQIGGVLALLTALEVACLYIDALKHHLALILIVVSVVKLILVAMYFMHLKGDAPVYTGFFTAGMIIAIAIFLGLLAMNPPAAAELAGGL